MLAQQAIASLSRESDESMQSEQSSNQSMTSDQPAADNSDGIEGMCDSEEEKKDY